MRTLLALLIFATVAQAQPRIVDVYHVQTQYMVSSEELSTMLTLMNKWFDVPGLRVRFRQVIPIEDKCAAFNTLADRERQFECWQSYMGENYPRKRVLQLVIAPPMDDGTDLWIAGYTSQICTLNAQRGIAMANAKPWQYRDRTGDDRIYASAILAAHELGHACGASHDNDSGANIMNSNAGIFGIAFMEVQFNQKAISEMRHCKKFLKHQNLFGKLLKPFSIVEIPAQ